MKQLEKHVKMFFIVKNIFFTIYLPSLVFVVSLHEPLNESTYYLIDRTILYEMKQEAMVINTSWGSLVDAKASVDCLKLDSLYVAALGVDEFEEK